jgi:hypothetical protein
VNCSALFASSRTETGGRWPTRAHAFTRRDDGKTKHDRSGQQMCLPTDGFARRDDSSKNDCTYFFPSSAPATRTHRRRRVAAAVSVCEYMCALHVDDPGKKVRSDRREMVAEGIAFFLCPVSNLECVNYGPPQRVDY